MLKHIISVYRNEFRMWMRQRTRPISVEEAEEKRLFWAKMYAITSILFLFYCTYHASQNQFRFSKIENSPEKIASTIMYNADNPVRILKYKGLKKVSDVTYSAEELSRFRKTTTDEASITKDPENSTAG